MKIRDKIKNWFYRPQVESLRQVDSLNDVIKQLEKDLDKSTKMYIASLSEKRQIKDELDQLNKKYDELNVVYLENKTKYGNLMYEYSNFLVKIEEEVADAGTILDALVPPK